MQLTRSLNNINSGVSVLSASLMMETPFDHPVLLT